MFAFQQNQPGGSVTLVSASSGPDIGCAGDSMAVTLVRRHFGQGGGVCFMTSLSFLYTVRLQIRNHF